MSRKGVGCLRKDKGRKWGPGLHEGLEKAVLGTFSRPCPVFPKTFDIKKAPQMNWKSPQKEKGFENEPQSLHSKGKNIPTDKDETPCFCFYNPLYFSQHLIFIRGNGVFLSSEGYAIHSQDI